VSYALKISEKDVLGKGKFKNAKGHTECVVFVQQATGAPETSKWEQGLQVSEAGPAQIPRGTAIATFDEDKKYPTDTLGKHAAIYLTHDKTAIRVLDQWNDQGEVLPRPIWFNRPKGTPRQNDASTFHVIK
jgi:hypothetical protein